MDATWIAGVRPGELVSQGDALAAMRASSARSRRLDIVASSDVARHWIQTAPPGTRSLGELRGIAAANCARLFGGSSEDWWIGAQWRLDQPFPCQALPLAATAPIRAACRSHGVRVRWYSAWALVAAGAGSCGTGWWALRTPTRVVLWHKSKAQLDAIAAWALPTGAPQHVAAAMAQVRMQVECGGLRGLEPDGIHWVETATHPPTEAAAALDAARVLTQPGRDIARPALLAWEDAPDARAAWAFGRQGRAWAASTASAAVLSVLACGAAGLESLGTWREAAVMQTPPPKPAHGVGSATTTPKRSAAQHKAWERLAAQLGMPWAVWLSQVQSVMPDAVALVAVEPDARLGRTRVQAEARDLDTLMRYAQSLAGLGPVTAVFPIRHEVNEQDPNRPVRMTLDVHFGQAVEPAADTASATPAMATAALTGTSGPK